MGSRQLSSILNQMPSATAQGEKKHLREEVLKETSAIKLERPTEEVERIVAQVPKILKEEIRDYLKTHKGETERTIVLKALKLMGFNVPSTWLIDKRSLR